MDKQLVRHLREARRVVTLALARDDTWEQHARQWLQNHELIALRQVNDDSLPTVTVHRATYDHERQA
jgi:CBS-domain-containing membrane protein